jgi:hypothetical protein
MAWSAWSILIMSTEDEKFEKIRNCLKKYHVKFCVIYRATDREAVHDMEWIRVMSKAVTTREDCDKFAARYHALAVDCFSHKKSKLIPELILPKGSASVPWFGLRKPVGTERVLAPVNVLGQRWWFIVIASGAAYKAGYAIVAKVSAEGQKDVRQCIVEIQCIIANASFLKRELALLSVRLKSIGTRKKMVH